MKKEHHYLLSINWTGNKGSGTSGYRTYERNHTISAEGKPDIFCSSDPAFRGDNNRYNPEELLVASIAGCHMLWFLHLCSASGIVVTNYTDSPEGIMEEDEDGSGRFTEVTLKPVVIVKDKDTIQKLDELHNQANKFCFIANSVNFRIKHNPEAKVAENDFTDIRQK